MYHVVETAFTITYFNAFLSLADSSMPLLLEKNIAIPIAFTPLT